jgi:hypothetical protein
VKTEWEQINDLRAENAALQAQLDDVVSALAYAEQFMIVWRTRFQDVDDVLHIETSTREPDRSLLDELRALRDAKKDGLVVHNQFFIAPAFLLRSAAETR